MPSSYLLAMALRELAAQRARWDVDDARVFRAIYPAQKDSQDKDLATRRAS